MTHICVGKRRLRQTQTMFMQTKDIQIPYQVYKKYWYIIAKYSWYIMNLRLVGRPPSLAIFGSDNGLSPGWRQAIIWTNDGILSVGPLWINFSEFLIKINTFSFKKMHFKMSSAKWQALCLGLFVLIRHQSEYCTKKIPQEVQVQHFLPPMNMSRGSQAAKLMDRHMNPLWQRQQVQMLIIPHGYR